MISMKLNSKPRVQIHVLLSDCKWDCNALSLQHIPLGFRQLHVSQHLWATGHKRLVLSQLLYSLAIASLSYIALQEQKSYMQNQGTPEAVLHEGHTRGYCIGSTYLNLLATQLES